MFEGERLVNKRDDHFRNEQKKRALETGLFSDSKGSSLRTAIDTTISARRSPFCLLPEMKANRRVQVPLS